jgi:hypothetical protein
MATSTKRITVQDYCAKHNQPQRKVRRHTRALGMGVGRGKRYGLTAADQRKLSKSLGI